MAWGRLALQKASDVQKPGESRATFFALEVFKPGC
jgi:hypothetical protein